MSLSRGLTAGSGSACIFLSGGANASDTEMRIFIRMPKRNTSPNENGSFPLTMIESNAQKNIVMKPTTKYSAVFVMRFIAIRADFSVSVIVSKPSFFICTSQVASNVSVLPLFGANETSASFMSCSCSVRDADTATRLPSCLRSCSI